MVLYSYTSCCVFCFCSDVGLLSEYFEFVPLVYIYGAGDLVDAVVPFMGESISDGTLAKFLKSMINIYFPSSAFQILSFECLMVFCPVFECRSW